MAATCAGGRKVSNHLAGPETTRESTHQLVGLVVRGLRARERRPAPPTVSETVHKATPVGKATHLCLNPASPPVLLLHLAQEPLDLRPRVQASSSSARPARSAERNATRTSSSSFSAAASSSPTPLNPTGTRRGRPASGSPPRAGARRRASRSARSEVSSLCLLTSSRWSVLRASGQEGREEEVRTGKWGEGPRRMGERAHGHGAGRRGARRVCRGGRRSIRGRAWREELGEAEREGRAWGSEISGEGKQADLSRARLRYRGR